MISPGKIHSKRVKKMWKYTQNELRRCKTTLETSGEDVHPRYVRHRFGYQLQESRKLYEQGAHDALKTTLETSVFVIFPTHFECSFHIFPTRFECSLNFFQPSIRFKALCPWPDSIPYFSISVSKSEIFFNILWGAWFWIIEIASL